MSEDSEEKSYPLRTLHDFIIALYKEWDKFRMASLIGTITSGVLFVFIIFRLLGLLRKIRRFGFIGVIDELIFLILVAAFVIYEISLLFGQYKFFRKWEKRIGLLTHLEERLMRDYEKEESK